MTPAEATSRPPRRPARNADRRLREIVTAEGLALTFTLASRGARVGALIIDLVLQGLVVIAVFLALGLTAAGLDRLGVHGPRANQPAAEFLEVLFFVSMFVLREGWFMFFELGPRGATPGKRIVGIRIAARDGARLTASRVIARNLLRDIELVAPFALLGMLGPGAAGWIAGAGWFLVFTCLPLWNRDALRGGDIIGGTWVVEAPRLRLATALSVGAVARVAGEEPVVPAGPATGAHGYSFGEAELAAYGEHELKTLERVLRDGDGIAMAAVAGAICARIGWTAPGDDEARGFLADYYMQLRARLEAGMRFGQRKADKFAAAGTEG